MEVNYRGEIISVEVRYSKRKTIGIQVDCFGRVEIVAPKGCPEKILLDAVDKKASWIHEKSKELKERSGGYKPRNYDHGEKFLYQGKSYPIQVVEEVGVEKNHVLFDGEVLYVYVKNHDEDHVKEALLRFYKQRCKALVEERIRNYQPLFQSKPTKVKICDANTYWGTCNSKRELSFHWKLAMAPVETMDYVVVHELCHMVHMNHDRSFWRLVGKILPDYEERQRWLALSRWKMTI